MPKVARSKTAPERTMIGIRCSVNQKRQLEENARAYGLTLTDLILKAALGELPDQKNATEQRFDDHEQRLQELERELRRLSELAY